ncbi:MAG: glycoside hydrolase family 9 protein [Deltaproteobacteria bacterium]|nr:glycoside hydrolase family 9 protein [Deltaproteobacteria bacterium]
MECGNCRPTSAVSANAASSHGVPEAVADVKSPPAPVPQPDNPLALAAVGTHELRIVSPTVLELVTTTTKTQNAAPEKWNFVDKAGQLHLPAPGDFAVTADGHALAVRAVGFRRRVAYATITRRDLRIGNSLYLELAGPIAEGAKVQVLNANAAVWPPSQTFEATAAPLRLSPAIHVNQLGYLPGHPKKAMVGYYLGSLGELDPPAARFTVVEEGSGRQVFASGLQLRRDVDQPHSVKPYRKVLEADFSGLTTPGEYRLVVPGLGASYPFRIDPGTAAAYARSFALGLYHQRCGESNALPFTRFIHAACHTAQADVPTAQFSSVIGRLSGNADDIKGNTRHTAPAAVNLTSAFYPFVRSGKVDVSGGHHDAGDYGKYTINSALLIHELIFAVDSLPGVAALDNLGLPESGDSISDVLQEAKKEADFLAKMQDTDGGFYTFVHPRDRAYEGNVLPDRGDPQVVFPKNTSGTAAAVAALAEASSSPLLRQVWPADAQRYLAAARKGWEFLQRATAKYGADGSYQRIFHYGDAFIHDDELAWAATEMYLATGDEDIHKTLLRTFDPSNPQTRYWTWMRLFEAYGSAIRSYAFAARSGRIPAAKLDKAHLAKCNAEILSRARELAEWAAGNAYGTSFPFVTKRYRTAGWYFSAANTFDLAVANALDPKPDFVNTMISNLNYDVGTNPNNVAFITGLGYKRQREIVHQYAQNDRRTLPPTGIPLGSVQASFAWLSQYEGELRDMTFPSDDDKDAPYPLYDRWADIHNVTTEFTVDSLGRAFVGAAYLMAQTPVATQPWKSATGRIVASSGVAGAVNDARVKLVVDGLDLSQAKVVWEADGIEPSIGGAEAVLRGGARGRWVEAEAQLPDGRRVFGVLNR